MNILIAEDEENLLNIIKLYLAKEGFSIFTATNGDDALNIVETESIDLAILDWMMPKMSGIEVASHSREFSDLKILMITARSQDEDEIKALESGIDDYIRKPFDPRILVLRVKKLLNIENNISVNEIMIDIKAQKAFKSGEDLNLTRLEYNLLFYFMQNQNQILSREKLLDRIWGVDYYGDYRTVDTHIRRLREKLDLPYIKTHRGMGYSFSVVEK